MSTLLLSLGFPGDSDSKESAGNAGHQDLIPGSGRCPGEGNGNPLQYSCLEIPRTEALVGFNIYKTAHRMWLRILSIALEEELQVLDFT